MRLQPFKSSQVVFERYSFSLSRPEDCGTISSVRVGAIASSPVAQYAVGWAFAFYPVAQIGSRYHRHKCES